MLLGRLPSTLRGPLGLCSNSLSQWFVYLAPNFRPTPTPYLRPDWPHTTRVSIPVSFHRAGEE